MKAFTVAALLAAIAVTTIAQAETYKWQDELCDIQGNFDNKKYSAKQIKNSHFVLEGLTRANLNSFFAPMDIEDLDKVSIKDLERLTEEYKQVKNNVERLDVVPEAKAYKQQLLQSIEGEYKKERLTILAYVDPIQAMRQSPLMCKQYLEPFFKDQIAVQNKWQQMVEKRALSNSYAMSRYQEEKANDPTNYAKIDLITFGFGNCVNNQRYHAGSEVVLRNQQKLNKTLFGKSLTMVCEEP
ncbi:hypothetical protein FQ082_09235 [Psychrobacter sp. ANT_H56B]|uniref:hypothetical protein n=1 Tax=Psychrobacter sp. ANT_H56B TaxID=2597353 RepID=UPI0011F336C0|nr:hypothetical protein [Psychrobacter sp. ANT_H56B]KAA0924771.1 hypothetical protein FQ082_09235 [Psychrobacter sp. ANT_H56B]